MADEQIIVDITYNTADAEKNVQDLTGDIVALEQANKDLRTDLKKSDEQLKQEGKSRTALSAEMAKNQQQLSKEKAARKDNINILQSEGKSINALIATNAALRKERNKVDTSTKNGQKQLKLLNKEIDKNDKAIKKNSDSAAKQSKNIGNYASGLGGFGGSLGTATAGVVSLTRATLAFIATPIGAIIAALGLALKALISYFKGSEEGQNKLNKIMTVAGAVIGNLKDSFRDFGKVVLDSILVMGAKFTKFFSKVGLGWEKLKGIFKDNTEAIEDQKTKIAEAEKLITERQNERKKSAEELKQGIRGIVEETKKEIEIAKQLADRQNALDKSQRDSLVENAKLQRDVSQLRAKAKDEENNTDEERLKALQEALALEKKILENNLAISKEKLFLKAEENKLSDSTKEDLQEEAQLRAEVFNQEKTYYDGTRRLLSEEQVLIKQINAEKDTSAKKDVSRREETLEKLRELELEDAISRAETVEEEKALKIEQENEEYERLISNDALLYEEKELLKVEHTNRLKEIDQDYVQSQEELARQSIDIARDSLNSILLAAGSYSDERFNIASNLGLQLAEISTQVKDTRQRNLALAATAAQGLNNLLLSHNQTQLTDLEAKKQAELALVGDNTEKREQIEKDFANKEAKLRSKQFKQEKALALVNVAIQTALAVTKAIAALPVPPFPFAIAAGALGIAQLGLIATKKEPPTPSFADGGLAKAGKFGGRSHSSGGTKGVFSDGTRIEVEKDENFYVLNKNASAHLNFLDTVNRRHGGASLKQRSNYMQDGGEADIGNNDITGQFKDALKDLKVVTTVESILTGIDSRQKAVNNGVV